LAAGCNGATPAPPTAGSAATSRPKDSATAAAATSPAKGSLVEGAMVRPHHEESVVECPVRLDLHDPDPRAARDDARRTALLDEANKQIEAGAFAAAWTCADRAADLAPTSVEAHHLRGAALAALGRDADAQTAYALALALDPDDPETLRAVADFYING